MSTQFCVATTLLHGTPTIAHMAQFGDTAVASLIPRIRLHADDALGLLACRLEAELEGESEPLIVRLDTDHTEYSYDRTRVSALIRGIGEETGVAQRAYDHIERFAAELPQAEMADVLAAFKEIQTAR
jgi:hypothetical protein